MDPAAINTFLDQFIGIVDSGFGLIEGDVAFVLNALIVISITLRAFSSKSVVAVLRPENAHFGFQNSAC